MDFSAYQKEASSTIKSSASNRQYLALGLNGEAGEVAEEVKKCIRDEGGILAESRRDNIEEELGDVLWYVASLATECGLDLQEIANRNIFKLKQRYGR